MARANASCPLTHKNWQSKKSEITEGETFDEPKCRETIVLTPRSRTLLEFDSGESVKVVREEISPPTRGRQDTKLHLSQLIFIFMIFFRVFFEFPYVKKESKNKV